MNEAIGGMLDLFHSKLGLYIIGGVIALVILSLLVDGIRRFIRGLDTALLGGVCIWLSYQASIIEAYKEISGYLLLIGLTLLIFGIILFVIIRIIRRKREEKKVRAIEREQAKHMKAAARDAEVAPVVEPVKEEINTEP